MEWFGPVATALLRGFQLTILLSFLGFIISVPLGLMFGVLSTAAIAPVRVLVRIYVEVFRALPTLVTLFSVFFMLPVLGFDVTALWAAVIGLSLWSSAIVSEIVRGAIQSIPQHQHRAGRALGLNSVQLFYLVILPQAARRATPPLVTHVVHMFQNSTLAGLIGLTEVVAAARFATGRLQLTTGESHTLLIYAAIGALFFLICYPTSRFGVWIERRLAV